LKDKDLFINVRVPPELKKLVNLFLETYAIYLNVSDFTRAALREKIQREAPGLYEELTRARAHYNYNLGDDEADEVDDRKIQDIRTHAERE